MLKVSKLFLDYSSESEETCSCNINTLNWVCGDIHSQSKALLSAVLK